MAESAVSHLSKSDARPVPTLLTLSPFSDARHFRTVSRLRRGEGAEFLHLGIQIRGSAAVSRHGTEVLLEPGDLVFCDPDLRGFRHLGDDCRVTVFRMPRRHLGVSESDVRRVAGVPVRGSEGVGAMVSVFLSALADEAELRGSRIGDRLARSAVDLVSALVGELLAQGNRPGTPDAPGTGNELLRRIKEFIELNLVDPDLSPTSIALAHHVSVRYLHKLFQSEGTTVSQWVRQRRLDVSRQELGRTSNRRTTVSAVARRAGFTSPSHFSRVFRDAYGMSPSEWQACTWSVLESPVAESRGARGRKSVPIGDVA